MKLVVVGGAPYAHDYIRRSTRAGDPRVLFPGYVFGRGYWELQRHAYVFCAPTEVGGTHPVILEALAAGNCVLVNDHAPNVETVGDAGLTSPAREGVRVADRAARAAASTSPSSSRSYRAPRPRARPALLVGRGHRPVRGAAGSASCDARRHGALPAELVDPPGPPPAGALITAADARETRLVA